MTDFRTKRFFLGMAFAAILLIPLAAGALERDIHVYGVNISSFGNGTVVTFEASGSFDFVGRRDGSTYAQRQGSGPRLRKKVAGLKVPAPFSMS